MIFSSFWFFSWEFLIYDNYIYIYNKILTKQILSNLGTKIILVIPRNLPGTRDSEPGPEPPGTCPPEAAPEPPWQRPHG